MRTVPPYTGHIVLEAMLVKAQILQVKLLHFEFIKNSEYRNDAVHRGSAGKVPDLTITE